VRNLPAISLKKKILPRVDVKCGSLSRIQRHLVDLRFFFKKIQHGFSPSLHSTSTRCHGGENFFPLREPPVRSLAESSNLLQSHATLRSCFCNSSRRTAYSALRRRRVLPCLNLLVGKLVQDGMEMMPQ
jgi:hypothetical protein